MAPRPLVGLSFGVMFFFSLGLGSVAAAVMGWLTDWYTIYVAFWGNTAVAAVQVAVTILLYHAFRNRGS